MVWRAIVNHFLPLYHKLSFFHTHKVIHRRIIDSCLQSTVPFPSERTSFLEFTSSVSHTMTSEPLSNSRLIIDALSNYSNLTGVDLSKNPFSEDLQRCKTPDNILELLQEREKAFKEYRDGNRTLINSISPAVRVLHAFSGFLGEAINLVTHILHELTRVGIPKYNPTRFPSNRQRLSLWVSMFFSPYVPSAPSELI